jgi:hypothetical protein
LGEYGFVCWPAEPGLPDVDAANAGTEVRLAATTRARVPAPNKVAARFRFENNSMKFSLSWA